MELIGFLGKFIDYFWQVLGKGRVKKSLPEDDVFLLDFPLLNNLLVEKILQSHLIILWIVVRDIDGILMPDTHRHGGVKMPTLFFCGVERIPPTVAWHANVGEAGRTTFFIVSHFFCFSLCFFFLFIHFYIITPWLLNKRILILFEGRNRSPNLGLFATFH